MKKDTATVLAEDYVESVLERMHANGHLVAFVVSAAGAYLGTIDRNSAVAAESGSKANSVATMAPKVCPDVLLEELITHTARTDSPVAVVDDGDRFLGSVDRTAIMLAIEGKMG